MYETPSSICQIHIEIHLKLLVLHSVSISCLLKSNKRPRMYICMYWHSLIWPKWTLAMALPWRQKYKNCPSINELLSPNDFKLSWKPVPSNSRQNEHLKVLLIISHKNNTKSQWCEICGDFIQTKFNCWFHKSTTDSACHSAITHISIVTTIINNFLDSQVNRQDCWILSVQYISGES